MTVVITAPEPDEPEPVSPAKQDDAAFAAGAVVGRLETHMNECLLRHSNHDTREAALESRIAQLEAAVVVTAAVAEDAEDVAEEALEESEIEEAPPSEVIEMEMPDIPTEQTDDPPKRKGHSWWS